MSSTFCDCGDFLEKPKWLSSPPPIVTVVTKKINKATVKNILTRLPPRKLTIGVAIVT